MTLSNILMGMERPFRPTQRQEARPRPIIEPERRPFTVQEVLGAMRALLGLEEDASITTREEKRNAQGLLFAFEFTVEGVPDKVFTFIAKGTHESRNESATTRVDWVSEDCMNGGQIAEFLDDAWVKKS